jgi:hypothetical protein
MGKWKPRLAARTGAGRIAQTRADLAEAAAQAEGLLGRKVLAKATRPDIVQNADIIDELMSPGRERLGWPTDPDTNRLLATIAMQVWNVSRTKGEGVPDGLADLDEMCHAAPELEPIVRDMVERARGMLPADRRLITGVSVAFRGSVMHIRAASVGTERIGKMNPAAPHPRT